MIAASSAWRSYWRVRRRPTAPPGSTVGRRHGGDRRPPPSLPGSCHRPGRPVGCRRNGLRRNLAQSAANRGGRSQLVEILCGLVAHNAWRRLMVSASSSAETYSPRADSASDSASRFIVAASRRMARVSWSAPRSSGAISSLGAVRKFCAQTTSRRPDPCSDPASDFGSGGRI